MGSSDCQYEVRIADGRLVLNGLDVEDLVDVTEERYDQKKSSDQLRSATLAFRAGYAIAAITRASGKGRRVNVHKITRPSIR